MEESLVLLSNAVQCFLLLAEAERRLSPRTRELYGKALEKFCAFAQAKCRDKITDFTPNLLRAAVACEMEQGHAPNWQGGQAMAITMVAATRSMVRRLQQEYPDLPLPDLSMVKAPKLPQRIQPRLEADEFTKLEAAVRLRLLRERVPRFLIARDMAILEVLANTGLRAAECCGLDVGDVDLDEGTIRVRKGKGAKWRILTVVDPDEPRDGGEVIRALTDYLRYRSRLFGPGRTPALWLSIKGNRLNTNNLRDALRSLCDEAGIDGNRPPHAFRRSHFTEQYRAQPTALPILVERMGWSSDSMAKVYTRGVEVELARRVPLPLTSKKWREDSPKGTSRSLTNRPILISGVGPPTAGVQRPGSDLPAKERQKPGRLPTRSKAGRRLPR